MKTNIIKYITICILSLFGLTLFSQELPVPKNYQLFTKYRAEQHSKFFKKVIESKGFIVMDGKESFLFSQEEPVKVKIKKIKDKITYTQADNPSINIELPENKKSIFLIFQNDKDIYKFYNITKTEVEDNKFKFIIIPKKKAIETNGIEKITIVAIDDKIQRMVLSYKTGYIEYFFSDTITGLKPNSKYFEE